MAWWRRGSPQVRRWREAAGDERPLAGATATDGSVVVGTRDALHLVTEGGETRRLPWEEVHSAHWDPETDTFRISEVGSWGETRPEHVVVLEEARLLLELVRERVTSSLVLQHDVTVAGRGGIRVIARRAPSLDGPLQWLVEYDEGVDPADDEVQKVVAAALSRARDEVGQT